MKYLFFLLMILVFFGCTRQKVKPNINESLRVQEIPLQESWSSTIIFSDSGKTKAIMWAGHVRMFKEETIIDSNLRVDFYNDFEKKTTTLTSLRGKMDEATRNLYAIGNVVATNDSAGIVLRTEELMWKNQEERIVSDKFVKITSPTEVIEGFGFESDRNLKNYTIYRVTYVTNRDTLR
ncbi:MAG: LPS export ABC transporter periplasmic protein LptC [Ignavibacteriales bacterium]|nr:LPS export ABC transporter periplasmic protein LptC [Ignavibacteriales bacterium]HPO55438.1 LPS export ABC transporter periplasmic protein LptC [Ignavibacteriaceae bacterium]